MSGGRGRGRLGAEDRALWDAVKKSIKPLRSGKAAPEFEEPAKERLGKARKVPSQPEPTHSARDRPVAKPAPLAGLDRRTRQRVARGSVEIDARLDLHGLTVQRARTRLERFLAAAQADGARIVLVITGKGAGAGGEWREGDRGALRRQVPLWLALPEFRSRVVGFEEAAPAHGGSGALYVRVRRIRHQRI